MTPWPARVGWSKAEERNSERTLLDLVLEGLEEAELDSFDLFDRVLAGRSAKIRDRYMNVSSGWQTQGKDDEQALIVSRSSLISCASTTPPSCSPISWNADLIETAELASSF